MPVSGNPSSFDLPNSNSSARCLARRQVDRVCEQRGTGCQQSRDAVCYLIQPYPATGVKYEILAERGCVADLGAGRSRIALRLNVTAGATPKLNAVAITTQPVPAFTSEKALPIQGFLPVVNYREYDILPKRA